MKQNSLEHLNKKGWVRISGGNNNVISTKVVIRLSEIGNQGRFNIVKKEKKVKINWDVLTEIAKEKGLNKLEKINAEVV